MPLPPPVIKIVSFVSFIIKCPLQSKTSRFRVLRTLFIGRCPLALWLCSLVRRPTDTSCDSRPDSPERFHHVPRDPERDGCAGPSSQSANPIAKAPRLHYHQLGLTRPVGQDRDSLQC